MANKLEVQTFDAALLEIKATFSEAEFIARMTIVEAHHRVGQIILSIPGEITESVHHLAVKLDRSERGLWYAVKFAQTFKTVDEVPEGKNISLNMIKVKYLTNSKELSEHVCTPITLCSSCHKRLDK